MQEINLSPLQFKVIIHKYTRGAIYSTADLKSSLTKPSFNGDTQKRCERDFNLHSASTMTDQIAFVTKPTLPKQTSESYNTLADAYQSKLNETCIYELKLI